MRNYEALLERVAKEYDCGRIERPFFRLERNAVVPERVAAGGAMKHRFVCALCATTADGVVGALGLAASHSSTDLALWLT